MNRILDIGCGSNPIGTVNCDLYLQATEHRNVGDELIPTKEIPNFVRCDAHFLPFREDSVEIVYSHHVLEHLEHPLLALKEWGRVAKDKLVVVVPDLRVSRVYGEFGPHIYSWSKWSLQHLMEKVTVDVEITVNRQMLQLRRKSKASRVINFVLKRLLIHFPLLQNSELQAVGHLT